MWLYGCCDHIKEAHATDKNTQRYAQISDRKLFRFVENVKTVCCGIWFCGVVITRICKHVSWTARGKCWRALAKSKLSSYYSCCCCCCLCCVPIAIVYLKRIVVHSGRVNTSMCSVVSGSLYQCDSMDNVGKRAKGAQRPIERTFARNTLVCYMQFFYPVCCCCGCCCCCRCRCWWWHCCLSAANDIGRTITIFPFVRFWSSPCFCRRIACAKRGAFNEIPSFAKSTSFDVYLSSTRVVHTESETQLTVLRRRKCYSLTHLLTSTTEL